MGIMRERARLIDAELRIVEPDEGGLSVSVVLAPEATSTPPSLPEKQVTTPR
jgi:nitrate/nitrite-specific signal transduction histidine kinase